MAIVVLVSAGGSPGTTTLAIGLALTWPRAVLLADADPGAHQAVLAGFLAGRSPYGKGLLRVAEAHRDRRPLGEVVLDQTLALTDDAERSRLFLPGFTRPGSAALFEGVWPDLTEALLRLGDVEMDVIVDAGRLGPAGLPAALLDQATVIALVTRSSLRAVMSAGVHLTSLTDQSDAAERGAFGVVVVGPGDPYGAGEIGRALGVRTLATIAHDPPSAAHLSDGRPRPRRFDTSPLVASLHAASDALARQTQRLAEPVRS